MRLCAWQAKPQHAARRPRGFGFIEFKDSRDAEDALYHLDRSTFMGREISVVLSKESRKTPRDMMHRERDTGPPSRGPRGMTRTVAAHQCARQRVRTCSSTAAAASRTMAMLGMMRMTVTECARAAHPCGYAADVFGSANGRFLAALDKQRWLHASK